MGKRQGGHVADKVWRRGQSGHKAGHKADNAEKEFYFMMPRPARTKSRGEGTWWA